MQSENPTSELSADQIDLGAKLGLDPNTAETEFVPKIEKVLGQNTLLEQARYFLLSILCHANRSEWSSLDDCTLPMEQQLELARQYIDGDEFKQSLRTVLKDDRFKFTLLHFAKARNVSTRTLSLTTKAYKHGVEVLKQKGLVDPQQTKTRAKRKSAVKPKDKGSLVDRRAARRGYFDEELVDALAGPVKSKVHEEQQVISDQEFAELDAKLGELDSPPENWTYNTAEDRLSLLTGLVLGCTVFAIVIWLFI